MLDREREKLIAEIKQAFSDLSLPKKSEELEIRGLAEKQPYELTVRDVRSNHTFYLFSDEEFKYFLPGYFVTMLQNPKEMVRSDLLEGLLRHLSQEYSVFPSRDICKLFDARQRKVILRFLDVFEHLWLSAERFEKDLSKVNPQQRDWAKKELEKTRKEFFDLLVKAKHYWQQCK